MALLSVLFWAFFSFYLVTEYRSTEVDKDGSTTYFPVYLVPFVIWLCILSTIILITFLVFATNGKLILGGKKARAIRELKRDIEEQTLINTLKELRIKNSQES